MTTKKNNAKKGVGIAATGVLLAAAAGYYFLYGSKNAKKNRLKVQSWALKAKADVMDQIEKAKELNEKTFSKIVDDVSKKYKTLKNVDPKELAMLASELKNHWKSIKRDIEKHSKAALQGSKK